MDYSDNEEESDDDSGTREEFDQEFIALARSVYQTNDERAEIKKEISLHTGSNFVEEKSYEDYS